jgi:glycosyltransferase involved in cell wall biosynthesis
MEADRPEPLPVGKTAAFFLYGTCHHVGRSIRRLDLVVDGVAQPVLARGMPRPSSASPHGGFWTVASIPDQNRPGTLELDLRASLSKGETETARLCTIEIEEPRRGPGLPGPSGRDWPTITVCMATFDPDPRHFRRQIASLRAQSDRDWICLISDDCSRAEHFAGIEAEIEGDDRFVISRSEHRLGFYRNFERVLGMVPGEAEFVALCDQDDCWYPEKLEVLRKSIGDAQMVCSDARLVNEDGQVIADSIWEGRRTNYGDLTSLLLNNTITGAATLFRRRILDRALPFPVAPGWPFHDHWLGAVALASGQVAYVRRPLYDYVQHPRGVLRGLIAGPENSVEGPRPGFFSRARLYATLLRWRTRYFHGYIPVRLWAELLLSRCSKDLTKRKRRALRRLIEADGSVPFLTTLMLRRLRRLWGRDETLGAESLIVTGILWRALMIVCAKTGRQPVGICDATIPHLDPQALEPKGWQRRQRKRAAQGIARQASSAGSQ